MYTDMAVASSRAATGDRAGVWPNKGFPLATHVSPIVCLSQVPFSLDPAGQAVDCPSRGLSDPGPRRSLGLGCDLPVTYTLHPGPRQVAGRCTPATATAGKSQRQLARHNVSLTPGPDCGSSGCRNAVACPHTSATQQWIARHGIHLTPGPGGVWA